MNNRKILHIITNLHVGGAEMMLFKLLKHSNKMRQSAMVITLIEIGAVGEKIVELGVPVIEIGMTRGRLGLDSLLQLAKVIKKIQPEIVQTWMYHADLLGGIVAKMCTNAKIVWGIRHSNLDFVHNNLSTILAAKLCAKISGFIPDSIVCCSNKSKKIHEEIGYEATKMSVIPNGFDLNVFMAFKSARQSVISEFSLPSSAIIIGLVGRYDRQKDHANFLQAAAIVMQEIPHLYFLLCGKDISLENMQLAEMIASNQLKSRICLLGSRNDMPRLFSAFDILVSSSVGEGFPNVLGEAMSCETPCVVTNVGDSALIVGETGYVVEPKDAPGLASSIIKMARLNSKDLAKLGKLARERIRKNFSIEAICKKYEDILC